MYPRSWIAPTIAKPDTSSSASQLSVASFRSQVESPPEDASDDPASPGAGSRGAGGDDVAVDSVIGRGRKLQRGDIGYASALADMKNLTPCLLLVAAVIALLACGDTNSAPFGKTDNGAAFETWGAYLGDEGRRHYTALTEIDSANLHRLRPAWTYHSGDATDATRVTCNPLYGDGRVYVVTAGLALAALDAGTGKELWRFSPFQSAAAGTWAGQSRGLHLWRDGRGDLKAVWAVADRLYRLDAATGTPDRDFGLDGEVYLREGLTSSASAQQIAVTTPGAVYGDLVILGFMTTEAQPAVRGCIRAFDLRTGEQVWRFGTIPDPDDPAAAEWDPDQLARAGGANNWCGMALDTASGLVFVPTGTAADDFYGADRLGDNTYANCLIALDAATGQRRWHRKLVYHDLWDYDLPSPPALVEVERDGQRVEAVAQPTKQGYVFVFERATGRPLFEIGRRPAPPSDVPGEVAAGSQPYTALPPFVPQALTAADLHPAAANAKELAATFSEINGGFFAPPSLRGTLMSPGFDGGANWGGAGTVPGSGILVLNANVHPSVATLREKAAIAHVGQRAYVSHCASCHGEDRAGGTFHGNIPSLLPVDDKYDRVSLAAMVHDGRGAMPAFAKLGDAVLDDIAAYLLDLPLAPGGDASAVTTVTTSATAPPAATTPATAAVANRYAHGGYTYFHDAEGYPAVRPPWGTITRYNLDDGTIAWQRPLGVDSVWASRGDSLTGTLNYGGPLLTATGLIFIGATTDGKLRALSLATGEELWRDRLPFDGVATPSSYVHEGQQYVLIAAGGGKNSARRGDAYCAYALEKL